MDKQKKLTESFGKKLSTLLVERKMTQAEFAEKVGISISAASRYANGLRKPSIGNMLKIAKFFGVKIEEFFND